jgi:DNA polymerase-3 subunit beta
MSSMKVRLDRATLADAAGWVAQAISKRPTTPAMGGMRLTAVDNTLTLAAFDYEASHQATVSAEVVTDGEVLVSGPMFRSIVSAIKGKELELVLDDTRLTVQAGRSTYRLGIMPLADYPTLPPFPKLVGRVSAEDLAQLVGTVEHAAAVNSNVPILEAINLRGGDGVLTGFATDRFRIARAETTLTDGTDDFEVNPIGAGISAALKGMTGTVDIGCEGGSFGLADGHRTVVVRVLDEEHVKPDPYFKLAPNVSVEVDTKDMAEAIKRATLVGDAHDRVLLSITPGELEITSDSVSAEGAEYVECTADGEISALFNGAFLVQSLLAVAGDRAHLGFVDDKKPLIIRPADASTPAAVVMPRRKTA